MPPNSRKRPGEDSQALPKASGCGRDADTSLADRTVAHPTACPCGHLYESDCVVNTPLPVMINYTVSSTTELGLTPHDRESCRHCKAVAA